MRHGNLTPSALFIALLCLSGCNGGDNDSTLDLGSVSIGDQLIDLKKARDADAISGREYRALKADLLTLVTSATDSNCDSDDDDDDDDDDDESSIEIRIGSDGDQEEEDSEFLF